MSKVEKIASFSCVYRISNVVNGKFYVGSAVHGAKRWYGHRHHLRCGTHPNQKLQMAWNKYGEASFRFSVVERVEDPAMLVEREQHHIDVLSPPYNLAPKAGSLLGYRHTPEAKAKMSAAQKGRTLSSETRRKLAALHRGKSRPEHIQEMLRSAQIGKKHSPETIQLLVTQRTGKKHSAERSLNISLGLMGNKNFSGKKHSPEAREKNRLAALAMWERRRAGHGEVES